MDTEPRSSAPPPLPRPTTDGEWRGSISQWREFLVDRLAASRFKRSLVYLIAAIVVATATAMLVRTQRSPAPIESQLPIVDAAAIPTAPAPTLAVDIVVHVVGAVRAPGLVTVEAGARVADAIAAAGGPGRDADLDRVNLAALVGDADRIAVPRVGEDFPQLDGGEDPAAPSGPLDINRASAAELESLPGVGPTIAAAIVAHRDEHGEFATIADLEQVAGIGPAKLAQLRDQVIAP